MAKEQTKPAGPKPPVWEIRHPTIVNGHIAGVSIKAGVGTTSDKASAAEAKNAGCVVLRVQ